MVQRCHFQIDDRYILTTDSPASHYGSPALRDEHDTVTPDYGPADLLPTDESAAALVMRWATRPHRTKEERDAARLFLAQWPDGPQLPE